MSHLDSDMDYYEWLNGPDPSALVAICPDCGRQYLILGDEPSDCCDTCLQRRTEFEVNTADARRI